ncbi:thymidylate kinase, partial [Planctomyces sp. SCGC AG-212-M04]
MSTGGSGARRGALIAIEGIDGSGKGTQAGLLRDALAARGLKTTLISFPRYRETFFGARIGDFLNGRFGSLDEVHPFLAATLFAGDRLESRPMLIQALETHDVVVLDRYVASNIAHQAAKRTGDERRTLAQWILNLEFDVNQLPRPDLAILLDLPASTAQTLIAKKNARTYTDRAADLQEADAAYLEEVRQVYLALAAEDSR